MLQNKQTGQPHTAKWATIIGGVISLACVIGVILGKLPTETLATLVAPFLGAMSMLSRNSGGDK